MKMVFFQRRVTCSDVQPRTRLSFFTVNSPQARQTDVTATVELEAAIWLHTREKNCPRTLGANNVVIKMTTSTFLHKSRMLMTPDPFLPPAHKIKEAKGLGYTRLSFWLNE